MEKPKVNYKSKSQTIGVRFTHMEYSKILEESTKLKLKPAVYCREKIRKGTVIVRTIDASSDKLLYHLSAVGNNLRQIARQLYVHGYSLETANNTEKALTELSKIITELKENLGKK